MVFLGFYKQRQPIGFGLFNMLNVAFVFLLSLIFSGCSQNPKKIPITELQQPPSEKIVTHLVESGDTLYGIARRYNVPLKTLLSSNGLQLFDTIVPGQVIYLDGRKPFQQKVSVNSASKVKTYQAPVTSVKPSPNKPVASKRTYQASDNVVKTPSVRPARSTPLPSLRIKPPSNHSELTASAKIDMWQWPLKGNYAFKNSSLGGAQKGIEIRGLKGDSVLSAADGEVVYAGEGLRGVRGKLVIVKHSERYLSAYSHVNNLRVRERQKVRKGQALAQLIGSFSQGSTNQSATLYFEIRDKGTAVNPVQLLPKGG